MIRCHLMSGADDYWLIVLARDIADIESATAALLKAEPELESWSEADVPAAYKPRPVWLIIGVLWLSTVLVTAGAVVAIATLAG